MKLLSNSQVSGDFVPLFTSENKHISDNNKVKGSGEKVVSSFAEMFNKALGETNELELKSSELAEKMAIDPESVDVHDVQIAAEEAEMAVLLTKGIVDRAIRAYKEIIGSR